MIIVLDNRDINNTTGVNKMTTTEYIAHSEKLATALLAFQTATGIEKTNLKAVYLAMPQLSAPEHDADIVA